VLNQSFLSGLNTLLAAVDDPLRYAGRWFALVTQGFVPLSGLARTVTQAIDPVYRAPRGAVESVKAITPGLSTSVKARRNRWGEEVRGPGGLRSLIVPEVSREVDDAVTQTLAQLGVRPTAPSGALTARGQPVPMTPEQEEIVAEAIGRERKTAVTAIILQPRNQGDARNFHNWPDEAKEQSLRNALERSGTLVRTRAKDALVRGGELTVFRLVSDATRAAMARERVDMQRLMRPDAGQ